MSIWTDRYGTHVLTREGVHYVQRGDNVIRVQ